MREIIDRKSYYNERIMKKGKTQTETQNEK